MPTYDIVFEKTADLHITASSPEAAVSMIEQSDALRSMAETEVDSAPMRIRELTLFTPKGRGFTAYFR